MRNCHAQKLHLQLSKLSTAAYQRGRDERVPLCRLLIRATEDNAMAHESGLIRSLLLGARMVH